MVPFQFHNHRRSVTARFWKEGKSGKSSARRQLPEDKVELSCGVTRHLNSQSKGVFIVVFQNRVIVLVGSGDHFCYAISIFCPDGT